MSIIKPHGYDSEQDTLEVREDISSKEISLDVWMNTRPYGSVRAFTWLTVDDALNLVTALLDALDIIDPPNDTEHTTLQTGDTK